MKLRITLQTPDGEVISRDIGDGLWVEAGGSVDRELGGLWGLPGLVDGHAHLARESLDYSPGDAEGARARAISALEAGVTLLLDKGWRDLTVVDLVRELPEDERPDIEAAGVILAVADGYWPGFAREVGPGGVEPAVTRSAREGGGWVKLIGDWPRKGVGPVANFTEDELATAVRTAEGLGARVAIHTMAREVPSMAVRAGVHSIEHGLFLTEDDLGLLGARAGSWVPTVLRVEEVIGQLGPESSGGRLLSKGLANVVANLDAAVEAGVHVLTGTDLVVGSDRVALEALRLWELGLPARKVIDAVSTSGLAATGRPARFEPGTPAHAVLFDEDPVSNPQVLAHPRHVIRSGRLIR
jgi:imidazolonepropionase-like amidohydrolase